MKKHFCLRDIVLHYFPSHECNRKDWLVWKPLRGCRKRNTAHTAQELKSKFSLVYTYMAKVVVRVNRHGYFVIL